LLRQVLRGHARHSARSPRIPTISGVEKFGKQRVDVSLVANYALVGARALGMRSERVWIVSDGFDDALNT
jgi:hypothetical protein